MQQKDIISDLDRKISNCKFTIKKYEEQLDKAKKDSRKKELSDSIKNLKEKIKLYNREKRKTLTVERNKDKDYKIRQAKKNSDKLFNKDKESNKQKYQKLYKQQYQDKFTNLQKQREELLNQIKQASNQENKLNLKLKEKQILRKEYLLDIQCYKLDIEYYLSINDTERIKSEKEGLRNTINLIKENDKNIQQLKSQINDNGINQLNNFEKENNKFSKKLGRIFSPKNKNKYESKLQQLKRKANLSESIILDLQLETLFENNNF